MKNAVVILVECTRRIRLKKCQLVKAIVLSNYVSRSLSLCPLFFEVHTTNDLFSERLFFKFFLVYPVFIFAVYVWFNDFLYM